MKNMKEEKYCDIIFFNRNNFKRCKKNDNKDFYNHLAHLIVHSLLHINNYYT